MVTVFTVGHTRAEAQRSPWVTVTILYKMLSVFKAFLIITTVTLGQRQGGLLPTLQIKKLGTEVTKQEGGREAQCSQESPLVPGALRGETGPLSSDAFFMAPTSRLSQALFECWEGQ